MINERYNSFTDLTKCQVEALLECFDFLRNGYLQVIDFNHLGLWIIKMKHKDNGSRLSILIRGCDYIIRKDGRQIKSVAYRATKDRYRLFVNSDMSVGVIKLKHGVDETLVKGSLSLNTDEG